MVWGPRWLNNSSAGIPFECCCRIPGVVHFCLLYPALKIKDKGRIARLAITGNQMAIVRGGPIALL